MHGVVKKLAYDAHLVMPYNLPYLIVLLQFTVQTNYIASELNAPTVAQTTPRLVMPSVESLSYFLVIVI